MSEENVTPQQQGGEGEEKGKVEKAFARNMAKLAAVLNQDPTAAGKTKLPAGDIPTVVSEMLKERKEKAAKEVSERLSKVLDQNIAFNKFVKQSEATLQKTILEKKKEFNKEMEACFALIDGIDTVAKEYEDLLKAGNEVGEEGKDTNPDEDLNPPGQA